MTVSTQSGGRAKSPADVHVGAQIAWRRVSVGLSQTALGERIGVSFQQVQKYEAGHNRVSCSRLWQIAEVLETYPGSFFPVPGWIDSAAADRIEAMAECARLLAQIKPAVDRACDVARLQRADAEVSTSTRKAA